MRYLLDTNVCVGALRGVRGIIQRLHDLNPDDCGVSTVTVYELYTGIERCRDPKKEQSKLELFLQTLHELPFEHKAALETARIRHALESKGMVIGAYDLLLAGQALAAGLVLVTHNQGEFKRVEGLILEDWED